MEKFRPSLFNHPAYAGKELNYGTEINPRKEKGYGNNHDSS